MIQREVVQRLTTISVIVLKVVSEVENKSGDCLIYSGPQNMTKMIKIIKRFSISTTLLTAGIQPFVWQQILSSDLSSFAIGFASITSSGMILSPLLLNWFTPKICHTIVV